MFYLVRLNDYRNGLLETPGHVVLQRDPELQRRWREHMLDLERKVGEVRRMGLPSAVIYAAVLLYATIVVAIRVIAQGLKRRSARVHLENMVLIACVLAHFYYFVVLGLHVLLVDD